MDGDWTQMIHDFQTGDKMNGFRLILPQWYSQKIDDIYKIRHILDSDIASKRYKYSRFPEQLTN